jgi:hypothetical protein
MSNTRSGTGKPKNLPDPIQYIIYEHERMFPDTYLSNNFLSKYLNRLCPTKKFEPKNNR